VLCTWGIEPPNNQEEIPKDCIGWRYENGARREVGMNGVFPANSIEKMPFDILTF